MENMTAFYMTTDISIMSGKKVNLVLETTWEIVQNKLNAKIKGEKCSNSKIILISESACPTPPKPFGIYKPNLLLNYLEIIQELSREWNNKVCNFATFLHNYLLNWPVQLSKKFFKILAFHLSDDAATKVMNLVQLFVYHF